MGCQPHMCAPDTDRSSHLPSDVSPLPAFLFGLAHLVSFWSTTEGPPLTQSQTSTEAEQQMFQAIMGCIFQGSFLHSPVLGSPDELGYRIKSPVVSQSMVYIWDVLGLCLGAASAALPNPPPGSPQNYPLYK